MTEHIEFRSHGEVLGQISFGEIYERYFQANVTMLVRRGYDPKDAQDIAQESFLSLLENWNDLKFITPSYVFGRTSSRAITNLQKFLRSPETELTLEANTVPENIFLPDIQAEYNETFDFLDSVIGNLEPQQTEILGYKLSGLTGEEIATKMGIAHTAVKSRLQRIYVRIREAYKKEYET